MIDNFELYEASVGATNERASNEGTDDIKILYDSTARRNRSNSTRMQASRDAVVETASQFPKSEDSEPSQQLANVLFDASDEPRVIGQRKVLDKSRNDVKKELAELYQKQAAEFGQEEADRLMANRINSQVDGENESSDDDVVVVASRPASGLTSQDTTKNSSRVYLADSVRLSVSSDSSLSDSIMSKSPSHILGNGSGSGNGYGHRKPYWPQASQPRLPLRSQHHQFYPDRYERGPNAGQKPGQRRRPKTAATPNDILITPRYTTVQPRRRKASADVEGPASSGTKKRRLMNDRESTEGFHNQGTDHFQASEASSGLGTAMDDLFKDIDQQDRTSSVDTASRNGELE